MDLGGMTGHWEASWVGGMEARGQIPAVEVRRVDGIGPGEEQDLTWRRSAGHGTGHADFGGQLGKMF